MKLRHIDAWARIQLKEKSKVRYFLKYTLVSYFKELFKSDFPEDLLCVAFNLFYKKWNGNNDKPNPSSYTHEDQYEADNDLYLEIKVLLEYWERRTWNPIDRVLDDQMYIRLVKIRHKLVFDV